MLIIQSGYLGHLTSDIIWHCKLFSDSAVRNVDPEIMGVTVEFCFLGVQAGIHSRGTLTLLRSFLVCSRVGNNLAYMSVE